MKFRFLSLGVVLSAFLFLVGCASLPIGKPEVKSFVPKFTGIDLQGLDMVFDIGVSNPYPTAIKSPKFKLGMDVLGSPFIEKNEAASVDLPALKTGMISVPVRVGYADLYKLYNNLQGANEVDYTIKGAIVLPLLGKDYEAPVSYAGKLPMIKAPTFKILGMRPYDITFSSAMVALDTEVANPNSFVLNFNNIGYDLKFGDVKMASLTAQTLNEITSGGSGKMTFAGKVSAMDAVSQILSGDAMGKARIVPTGAIQTPYGPLKLDGLSKLVQ